MLGVKKETERKNDDLNPIYSEVSKKHPSGGTLSLSARYFYHYFLHLVYELKF